MFPQFYSFLLVCCFKFCFGCVLSSAHFVYCLPGYSRLSIFHRVSNLIYLILNVFCLCLLIDIVPFLVLRHLCLFFFFFVFFFDRFWRLFSLVHVFSLTAKVSHGTEYKFSYLLKYDAKFTSSSGEYEQFSKWPFCEKENSFSMGLLWLVRSKTCFWNSSCLSWFSFQICQSNFSIFSTWESSCFCHFSSILFRTALAVHSGTLPDIIKYFWNPPRKMCLLRKKNRKICNLT